MCSERNIWNNNGQEISKTNDKTRKKSRKHGEAYNAENQGQRENLEIR